MLSSEQDLIFFFPIEIGWKSSELSSSFLLINNSMKTFLSSHFYFYWSSQEELGSLFNDLLKNFPKYPVSSLTSFIFHEILGCEHNSSKLFHTLEQGSSFLQFSTICCSSFPFQDLFRMAVIIPISNNSLPMTTSIFFKIDILATVFLFELSPLTESPLAVSL